MIELWLNNETEYNTRVSVLTTVYVWLILVQFFGYVLLVGVVASDQCGERVFGQVHTLWCCFDQVVLMR